MAQDDGAMPPRKGRLSAFALLKSWLFDKRSNSSDSKLGETEFLNSRDGYELAKFAKQAFGQDKEKQQYQATVEAEQAEIDAILRAKTDVVAINHGPVEAAPPAPAPAAPAAVAAAATAAALAAGAGASSTAPAAPAAAAAPGKPSPLDMAVRYLEKLHEQGLSVEIMAEALIEIESRKVRQSQGKSA